MWMSQTLGRVAEFVCPSYSVGQTVLVRQYWSDSIGQTVSVNSACVADPDSTVSAVPALRGVQHCLAAKL